MLNNMNKTSKQYEPLFKRPWSYTHKTLVFRSKGSIVSHKAIHYVEESNVLFGDEQRIAWEHTTCNSGNSRIMLRCH